ncbi:uncharacterized protein K02A2.6-like [Ischnura elegans]|uniref:uncharacterized protein K02A2.6-like n=1 Tax=Ischnura elegans TaxID=197161 RepID=UPI001ED8692A|nr:uncharacterized protein K02A2.6-like [Ischnura elegans]
MGVVKMKAVARDFVWWPELRKDLENITKTCTGCQITQNSPSYSKKHHWEWPEYPGIRWHLDFAGPFQGSMYLIVIDAHSKWPEVFKMKNIRTDSTIDVLHTLIAKWGIPKTIVTDNGPQLTSSEFKKFCHENGIRHLFTAPYNPSSNGLAERGVQTFKKALTAATNDKGSNNQKLQRWLLKYRSTPHCFTGKPPAELQVGRQLRKKLTMLKQSFSEVLSNKKHTDVCTYKVYHPGDLVNILNYGKGDKWINGVVVKPIGNKMYVICTSEDVYCVRNLKQILSREEGDGRTPMKNLIDSKTAHTSGSQVSDSENYLKGDGVIDLGCEHLLKSAVSPQPSAGDSGFKECMDTSITQADSCMDSECKSSQSDLVTPKTPEGGTTQISLRRSQRVKKPKIVFDL